MSTIYLIRHAEKPDPPDQGIDETGNQDPESLIPRGWQRAGALAVFFGCKEGLPAPDRIYAAAAGNEKVAPHEKAGSKSKRPMQTVAPLAAKLALKEITKFTKGEEAALAKEIVQLDGTTLVSWQHEAIPEIAGFILGSAHGIPNPWPGDRFDVVWCFARSGPGKPWKFTQVCQSVLSGDSSKPIA